MKKSQVTLFIVLGIILILVIAILIYALSGKDAPGPSSDLDAVKAEITNFLRSCVEQHSRIALDRMASNGGSFESTVHAYQTAGETVLTPRTLYEAEQELSQYLEANVPPCADFKIYEKEGIKVIAGTARATVKLSSEGFAEIKLDYPMNVTKGTSSGTIDGVSERVAHHYMELYQVSIDILNQETVWEPVDKERMMLDNPGLSIELHRPYPDTIYQLSLNRSGRITAFPMQIDGKDTAGREVLTPKKPSRNACIDKMHGICYQNMQKCEPPFELADSVSCDTNLKPQNFGCCITESGCEFVVQKSECKGRYENSSCDFFACPNFDCDKTYSAETASLSGDKRVNSESWCMYESRPGWGRDYVGTRHYKHSCIYGREFVEECRDYREELCTRNAMVKQDGLINTAECKTNRWWDCTAQESRNDCLDTGKRDCMWMGEYFTPWYNDNNCVPFVPPGLKFWEGEGVAICNQGSEDPNNSAKKKPKTWSYGNFLACIRMGDCGNYRNVADRITETGYFHPYGQPEAWVYWDEGWIKDGGVYGITDLGGKYDSSATSMPGQSGSYFVTCGLWQAPPGTEDCDLCESDEYRPCTEYRCKSLGKCVFSAGKCSAQRITEKPLKISFNPDDLTEGHSGAVGKSDYYPSTTRVLISPGIPSYSNFSFGITTDKESRCALSLKPPLVPQEEFTKILNSGFSPSLWLSGSNFSLRHNVTLRLPAPDTSKMLMPRWQIFVQCIDRDGNKNKENLYLDLNVLETTDAGPHILAVSPEFLLPGQENEVEILVDRPFAGCKYGAGEAMADILCQSDMRFDLDFGFAYVCDADLVPVAGGRIVCRDAQNRTAVRQLG